MITFCFSCLKGSTCISFVLKSGVWSFVPGRQGIAVTFCLEPQEGRSSEGHQEETEAEASPITASAVQLELPEAWGARGFPPTKSKSNTALELTGCKKRQEKREHFFFVPRR